MGATSSPRAGLLALEGVEQHVREGIDFARECEQLFVGEIAVGADPGAELTERKQGNPRLASVPS